MNITKLPSGSYRYRKTIDGRTISCTFDHVPSEREIMLALAKKLKTMTPIHHESLPFDVGAVQYVNLKRNVLSPRTIKEYTECPERLSQSFREMDIYKMTALDIQTEINNLAKDKSPKTVRNYHGFISAVVKTFRPDFAFNTTLPQKEKKEPYIPTDDEIKKFIDYIKENRPRYYVLVTLAICGLRRSEIMAITSDDVKGNVLSVNKAKVLNEDNEYVIKATKTTESTREIVIPQDVADMIKENGLAFDCYPSDIKKVIDTACKKLGIQHFTLHKLRHYFASKLLSENVDMTTVMALGGWSSPAMLHKHYAHALEEKKKSAMTNIHSIFRDKS